MHFIISTSIPQLSTYDEKVYKVVCTFPEERKVIKGHLDRVVLKIMIPLDNIERMVPESQQEMKAICEVAP